MTLASSPDWTQADSFKSAPWIDRWAEMFLQWLDARLVKQAAGEVARECRAALAARAVSSIGHTGAPQCRGYLRALAPVFVVREIDAVLSRRRISRSLRAAVFAEAIEQAIELVVDDIACARPALAPARLAKAA
jgi:hypothetical protein